MNNATVALFKEYKSKLMAIDDTTPTYNLKAVVLETGLKPVTLRAWERRYGLPQPDRTAGGHRLYSQRDIDILKWLIARQEEGVSISQAVAMWHSLEEDGENPLGVSFGSDPTEQLFSNDSQQGNQLSELRQAWIEACFSFDGEQAEQVLSRAFSMFSPELVCKDLLQRGLAEIGMAWFEGKATVQQEHFASALAIRRLEMLVAATPAPVKKERIVIGCAPKETHTFSPLLLTFLLRRRGWDVVYLGADVPGSHLAMTLDQIEPHLVIFSAQQLHTAATLLEMASMIEWNDIILAYGGLVFNQLPDLQKRIPGHWLGATLDEAVENVQKLLQESPKQPEVEAVPAKYAEALAQFQERRGLMESHLWHVFRDSKMPIELLTNINLEMAQTVTAALKLSDMKLMDSQIDWVKELLLSSRYPTNLLKQYLIAYHDTTKLHLDQGGAPIVEWLEQLMNSHVMES